MHVYRYPLVESGTKTGLRVIALCKNDRVLLSKHSKIDFSYNDNNVATVCYGDLIISIL